MNDLINTPPTDPTPDPFLLTDDLRMRVPDTSMLPGSEKASAAAQGLLNQAVDKAHHTIDRLADSAGPAVRRAGEQLSATEEALHAKAGHLRQTGDEWLEGLRASVRRSPLTGLVMAMALGAMLSRLSQSKR
jgi:hypothetical protein